MIKAAMNMLMVRCKHIQCRNRCGCFTDDDDLAVCQLGSGVIVLRSE